MLSPTRLASGCGMNIRGEDLRMLEATLAGHARHATVAGYIVCGLGCEVNQASAMIENSTRPPRWKCHGGPGMRITSVRPSSSAMRCSNGGGRPRRGRRLSGECSNAESAEIGRRISTDPEFALQIERLRAEPGEGDIAIGGATLAAEAAALDLIDEYRVMLYPVLVGGGIPFFPRDERRVDLEFVETRTFGSGVVYLRYRVAR